MTMIKKYILALIVGLPVLVSSQVFTEQNVPAPVIAGAAAAGIATNQDAWSIFFNPAGLTRLATAEIATALYKPYGLNYLSNQITVAGIPLKRYGGIGIGFFHSGVSYNGNDLTNETAINFSHAFFLQKDIHSTLALGYSVNVYQLEYGTSAGISGDGSDGINLGSAATVGCDLGLQASLHQRTWLGVLVHNLNSPELGSALSKQSLPKSLAIGFGYEPYEGLTTNFMVVQTLTGNQTQYRGGIVYRLAPWLTLRTGAMTEPSRISGGFSVEKWGLCVDYAYLSHNILPATHQFGFGYSLRRKE